MNNVSDIQRKRTKTGDDFLMSMFNYCDKLKMLDSFL